MKLTVDTITDAQIRGLKFAADLNDEHTVIYECRRALGEIRFDDIGRVQTTRQARQRCAEIINARSRS